jgi:hypothetical protein
MIAPTAAHCTNTVMDGDEDGKNCGGEDCVACDANVKAIFAKQVWMTEFASTTDDCGYAGCATNQVTYTSQTFIPNWVAYNGNPGAGNIPLEKDSFVFRYAWFMPKVSSITSLNAESLLVSNDTTHNPTQTTTVGTAYNNASYGSTCTPATCASLGDNCGSPSNGCGGTLSCGTCTSPQTCGGGGTSYVCGGGSSQISISSSSSGAYQTAPSLSYDNSTTTRYGNDGTLGSAWVTYTLSATKSISKVRLLMYSGSTRTYPIQIKVGSTVVFTGTTTASTSYWEKSFTAVSGNTVTVTMTGPNSAGSNWFSMWETQVYGQ